MNGHKFCRLLPPALGKSCVTIFRKKYFLEWAGQYEEMGKD